MTQTDNDPGARLMALFAPGGPFEMGVEDVLGVPTQVYRQRRRSLREMVEEAGERAEVGWLAQGERSFTFGEHNALVRQVAAGLAARGVGRGDRVAICSANTPEWVVSFWAAAVLGAIAVPLNAWWKTEELEFGLSDSGSVVLVADAKRVALLRGSMESLDALRHVFVIGDDVEAAGPVEPFDALYGPDPGVLPDTPIDEDDVVAILYTSGTTGKPKGATITHRQVIANVQNITLGGVVSQITGSPSQESAAGLQPTSLLVVPLFHVTGCLATMTLNYATGARLVLMPAGRFDPDLAMQIIEREKVTSIGGVPTIMWRIVESPNLGRYDLSSVKRASYGGAPAAPELVARITEVFPNLRSTLSTAYGLTETASVATAISGEDYVAHPGSVGKPVPTVELRIVGPDGDDVPAGEQGEIWLKGPTVMAHGYWNRPDANAEVLTDGWFHTGDIGKVDPEGYLYLVDRAKDMIIRAGENVYCVEIEHVLFEHPDVVDAAVVGVPHKELGEEVKAVVQIKEGSSVTAEDLRAHCRAHLADFKVPEYVDLRSEPLPRNPAGKVLKNLLRGADTSFGGEHDDQAL